MRILIVDDERPARDKLRHFLGMEPDVTEILEAREGIQALEIVHQSKPDAMFLDIQMPEMNGLEIAVSLPDPPPLLVFVTGHDRYALQAFEANAVDYLMKPYDMLRFERTLARVRERLRSRSAEPFPKGAAVIERLLVPDRGATKVLLLVDILWIETADNYVQIHTNGRSYLMRQTLSGLLERLGTHFVRCHRRAAVRVAAVEGIVTLGKGDCQLVLTGGVEVPCSRQYRAHLESALK
ncbi:MAG: response regulator transcription factor [Burkholderiaceae bacterium]|nr:response regulator transcription factor [Burkholderiaceae bacterium]